MASAFSGRAGRLAGMWGAEQAQNFYDGQLGTLLDGRDKSLAAINGGRTSALGAIDAGYDAARPEYAGAIARYQPYVDAGTRALTTYEGSLGLGGDSARDAAVSSFREAPGYRYAVDEATDAVARKASATGALGSGNTLQAISDRAQGMADQGYKDWQGQVKGLSDAGLTATGAQAGIQTQMGNLNAQEGRDNAGIYTGAADRIAGIETGFAQGNSANLGQLGQTVISAGTGALLAGQTAAQNRLNLGMAGLNLAGGVLGSYLGGRKAA